MNSPYSNILDEAPAATTVSARDLVALVKPRITLTVLMTALGGLFLARPDISRGLVLWTMLGTAMIVGGANALNMFLERDSDRHMARTKTRPLPAGRMAPSVALIVGLALSVLAIPVLIVGTNVMTAVLAAIANVSYVMVYTPLKQRSWTAVIVGAVPGAIPPLLGWTAASGALEAGGVALFAIMFFWQVPHFHAIALFRESEYTRAGLRVLPALVGEQKTRRAMFRWSVALVASSFVPYFLGVAGASYAAHDRTEAAQPGLLASAAVAVSAAAAKWQADTSTLYGQLVDHGHGLRDGASPYHSVDQNGAVEVDAAGRRMSELDLGL